MNRTKSWLFVLAFAVILILTIIEGVNDGFTFLNWLVIAVSVVFGGQALYTIARDGSPPS